MDAGVSTSVWKMAKIVDMGAHIPDPFISFIPKKSEYVGSAGQDGAKYDITAWGL